MRPAHDTPTRSRRDRRRGLRHRRRLIAVGAVLTAGALGGTGVALANAVELQQRVDATAALTEAHDLDPAQLGVYAGIAEARAHARAEDTITAANAALAEVGGTVDGSELASSVASLGEYETLPVDSVADLAAKTEAETARLRAAAAEVERAQAAAAAEAERVAAEALARANTPEGAKATAASLAASQYGWSGSQFTCLVNLWQKESGWRFDAENPSSGAYGIPQSLPGSKMATAGADWATNASTQIAWGLDYISRAYGTPCSAWSHSQSVNWY